MLLNSRNPIGVNAKLYYEIIGEKNLRKKRLIWINWKVLDLIERLWKVRGTIVQFFPKSKISLTLLFFILYKVSRREYEIKISAFFLLLPDSSSPPYLHFLQSYFLLKILQPSILLAFKINPYKRILRFSFVSKECHNGFPPPIFSIRVWSVTQNTYF